MNTYEQNAAASMERIGREDCLRGDAGKRHCDLRRAGYSDAEIAAYQRGFDAAFDLPPAR